MKDAQKHTQKHGMQFPDFGARLVSAVILLVIAGVAIGFGGLWFAGFLAVMSAVMVWEVLAMWRAGAGSGSSTENSNIVAFLLVIASITAICASALALSFIRELSLPLLVFLILCVLGSDIGGYFIGRLVGGPRLWVRISPNKTWSGTIGGWALAIILGGGFMMVGLGSLGGGIGGGIGGGGGFGLGTVILIAFLLALSAQAGDLTQSAMKRYFGVKDSSNLLPGHGGLFDRFDGMIAASLVLFAVGFLI